MIAALAQGCASPDDLTAVDDALKSIVATCSYKSGDVQLKRMGEGFWSEAQVASVFRAGDWVKTGRASGARIELVQGGALALDEDAALVLEADPEGADSAQPLVAVQSGAVTGSFTDPSASALRIRMADGSEAKLAARGDEPVEFRIARAESATELTVSRGAATLDTQGGERHDLEQGAVAAIDKGQLKQFALLPPPSPVAPAPDEILPFGADPVSLEWSALDAARGYRLQLSRAAGFGEVLLELDVDAPRHGFSPAEQGAYFWRVAARDDGGRLGGYSRPSRLFALPRGPANHLLRPADRAEYGYLDTPPKITFSWNPAPGEERYQLVIARSPDLLNDRIKADTVDGLAAMLEGLEPGSYYWGVYTRGDVPLFTRPYKLSVTKSSRAVLKAPKKIKKWGK